MKRVCVYCGSGAGGDPAFAGAASAFGKLLAEQGLGLVYGGGRVGLMGVLADAALAAGGEVVGVIPEALARKEVEHRGVTRLLVVANMHERKRAMADFADAFVALPGGVGTLEELFESFTWLQLGYHAKPVGVLNVNGYFDHLLAFLRHTVASRLLKQRQLDQLLVETDPASLLDRLRAFEAPAADRWPDRRDRV
jgi:uncharacterized protein (TIGR00730 family)